MVQIDMLPPITRFNGIGLLFPSPQNKYSNNLCPRGETLIMVGRSMTVWLKKLKKYPHMDVSHQSSSFKGGHYIPVRKTEAFWDCKDTARPAPLCFFHATLFTLIFLPSELIIVRLMGFKSRDVERKQDRSRSQDDPFISSEQAASGPQPLD